MDTIIGRDTIQMAMEDLAYRNKKAPKYLLLDAIIKRYPEDPSLPLETEIPSDNLIMEVWDTGGDPSTIANRRKNFNSIKSAINADLKLLYKEGKNPSGIIIGPENTFVMSDEAREQLLASLARTAGEGSLSALDQLAQMMGLLKQILSDEEIIDPKKSDGALSQIHRLLKNISQKLGLDQEDEGADEGGISSKNAKTDNDNTQTEFNEEDEKAGDNSGEENEGILVLEDELDEDFEDIKDEEELEENLGTAEEDYGALGMKDGGGDAEILDDDEDMEIIELDPDEELEDLEDVELGEEDPVKDAMDRELDGGGDGWDKGTGLSEEDDGAMDMEDGGGDAEILDDDEDMEIIELDPDEELEDLEDVELGEEDPMEDAMDRDLDGGGDGWDKGTGLPEEDDGAMDMEDGGGDAEILDDDEDMEIIELDPDEELEDLEDAELGEEDPMEDAMDRDLDGGGDGWDKGTGLPEGDDGAMDMEGGGGDAEILDDDEDMEIIELDPDEELEDLEDAELGEEDPMEDAMDRVLDGGGDGWDKGTGLPGEDDGAMDMEDAGQNGDILDDDDEDMEIIELDPDEELEDLEIIEEDDDLETIEVDEAEELKDMEDVRGDEIEDDVLPEEDFEEVEEELEDISEDREESLEEVDLVDDEEIEEIDADSFGEDDLEEEGGLNDNDEDMDSDVEEDFEEVGFLEDDEELEILEDDQELEEVEEEPEQAPLEPSMGALGADPSLEQEPDTARILAEQFDGFLGSMEKHYNQYLLIPEGTYVVGAKSPGKGDRPIQKIDMTPFYMGKYPVTNALFEIFVEKTGYITTAEERGYGMVYTSRYEKIKDSKTGKIIVKFSQSRGCEKVEGANWYQPWGPGSTLYRKRNHPVVQVSRRDAIAFAAWTGKKLPSENEWEAAARTQKGLIYPWGNEWEDGKSNTEESKIGDTCPVELFTNTNSLNISGMVGNILEWTTDLADISKPEIFIVKGSSWVSSSPAPLHTRTLCKNSETSNILGFRCVAI